MTCFHPLKAYQSFTEKTPNGKKLIVFDKTKLKRSFKEIELACGQCIGCRIGKSREWALRCMHEASLYDHNCFITLTIDDEHMPKDGSIYLRNFQLFMKKLRAKYCGVKGIEKNGTKSYPIRYFHCAEYGDIGGRPHHHACLFNFDFFDKQKFCYHNGNWLYRSYALEGLWKLGYSWIGSLTFQSAAYVARYIVKKVNGSRGRFYYTKTDEETGELIEVKPECATMSRRPGIGKGWYEKFKDDLFPKDFVTIDGKKFPAPKYYDKLLEAKELEEFEKIKKKRLELKKKNADNYTEDRLKVRKTCLVNRVKNLKRELENG